MLPGRFNDVDSTEQHVRIKFYEKIERAILLQSGLRWHILQKFSRVCILFNDNRFIFSHAVTINWQPSSTLCNNVNKTFKFRIPTTVLVIVCGNFVLFIVTKFWEYPFIFNCVAEIFIPWGWQLGLCRTWRDDNRSWGICCCQWVPGVIDPRVKRSEHKAGHKMYSTIKVKNAWNYTSILGYVFGALSAVAT